MTKHVTTQAIYDQLGLRESPLLLDVRSTSDFERTPRMVSGSIRFDAGNVPEAARKLPLQRPLALYSTGKADLDSIAISLSTRGHHVSVMDGGIDRWIDEKRPTIKARPEFGVPGESQWVTRERPKIDRIACPWLIRRFIDPLASFFYVPAPLVRAEAASLDAQPYDIPDVTFSHRGPNCSFDAFLDEFDLHDPVLDGLADIVRAADTGQLEQSREAPGLLAISLGLSASIRDDQLLLEQAMSIYDALYTWRKTARDETHSWPQKAAKA